MVLFTIFAFAAAASAAIFAKWAFNNEIEPRLGEDACTNRRCTRRDRVWYLSSDIEFLPKRPLGSTEKQYRKVHHAFTNLGRNALGNVVVKVCFLDKDGFPSPEFDMPLGNLGVADLHRERHVEIRIHEDLYDDGDVFIRFNSASADGKKIKAFLKVDPEVPTAQNLFILPNSQLSMGELMREVRRTELKPGRSNRRREAEAGHVQEDDE
ncbi:MAG TPA: hypothetical protein VJP85_05655 [Candidatus Baltobacteraceae bacterium]|nr:hypothetical protein [Candidatus Baltobacteraceae bacterium]